MNDEFYLPYTFTVALYKDNLIVLYKNPCADITHLWILILNAKQS